MKKGAVLKIDIGNITIKVVMQGFWHGEVQLGSPMHNHAAFEFHTLLRGSAVLETNQKSIQLKEKDSVLIPPESFHSFQKQEKGAATMSFTFFLERNRHKNVADYDQLITQRLLSAVEPVVFSQNLQLEEYLTGIMSNLYSHSLVAEDRIKARFILLFTELFSLFADQESAVYEYEGDAVENDTRIYMIEEYFNEYYTEPISLKNLAECLYLSEKQTDKMIRKAFGEGFRDHLCKLRLLIARKLLIDTDKEIREIAEEVGYQSYNGFYLAFKEKVGMTPGAYREQYLRDHNILAASSGSKIPPFS